MSTRLHCVMYKNTIIFIWRYVCRRNGNLVLPYGVECNYGRGFWYYGLGLVLLCHIAVTSLHHKHPQPSPDFSNSQAGSSYTWQHSQRTLCSASNRLLSWRQSQRLSILWCRNHNVLTGFQFFIGLLQTSRSICSSPIIWPLSLSVSKFGS
jgi:hypothetical protein